MTAAWNRIYLLTDEGAFDELSAIIRKTAPEANLRPIQTEAALSQEGQAFCADDLLLSIGTSIIVPSAMLSRLGAAYNFHAASPDYPGRDPHHFAVYDQVRQYGATAHRMEAKVDSGVIVGTSSFDVPDGTTPSQLLALAAKANLKLFERLAPVLIGSRTPPPATGDAWGPRKTTRADFRELCQLSPDLGPDEFFRRLRACQSDGHTNAILTLFGKHFHLQPIPQKAGEDPA